MHTVITGEREGEGGEIWEREKENENENDKPYTTQQMKGKTFAVFDTSRRINWQEAASKLRNAKQNNNKTKTKIEKKKSLKGRALCEQTIPSMGDPVVEEMKEMGRSGERVPSCCPYKKWRGSDVESVAEKGIKEGEPMSPPSDE